MDRTTRTRVAAAALTVAGAFGVGPVDPLAHLNLSWPVRLAIGAVTGFAAQALIGRSARARPATE